jgi:hypothetical protein
VCTDVSLRSKPAKAIRRGTASRQYARHFSLITRIGRRMAGRRAEARTNLEVTMGMYLAIYAVSDVTIERLHTDPPLAWRVMDPEMPELEAKARAELQPRPGFLARLRGARTEPPTAPPPLELAPGEGDLGPDGDFEKSWQALHYVLTGTAWEGEPPLNFLMGGGRELEVYGHDNPVLTHSSDDTRRISDALVALSDDEARRRVNTEEMVRLEIYPGIWNDGEGVAYLLDEVRRLRETVSGVARRGLGLLISIA